MFNDFKLKRSIVLKQGKVIVGKFYVNASHEKPLARATNYASEKSFREQIFGYKSRGYKN